MSAALAEARASSVGALVERATRQLRAAGFASPRLEAELLLGHCLRRSRSSILAHPERTVPDASAAAFKKLVARRLAAEPIAFILGEREFYGRVFKVDRRALIPRPETELLVDLGIAAVDRLRRLPGREPRVLEIGTGSGAIAISLAAERHVGVVATDVSLPALELARENAVALGQAARVRLVQCDLLRGVRDPFDIVLANLPYVPTDRDLPADVRDYEPHVALFGGRTGTELIERLLHEAHAVLASDAELAVELDEEDQAHPVAALARTLFPTAEVSIRQDAGGYDRVVHLVLPHS